MKKRKKPDEISFWQSQADLVTALVLILLLIILLLSLYLMRTKDNKGVDEKGVAEGVVTVTPAPTITPYPSTTPVPLRENHRGGGGGGGGGGGEDEDGEGEEEGDEPFEEEGEKSAVYVMLVDGDTGLTVKEEGVTFEIYKSGGPLLTLSTYYPEKIIFRDYMTTEEGVFFLPEKIHEGRYNVKNTTEPEGYDRAPDISFVLDEYYDWDEPYVVRVPIYPSRNRITVYMSDKDTQLPLPGGVFEVVAAENIVTKDGTTRYKKNEVVSEITCGDDGTGVSDELYIGKYLIRQKEAPEFYAFPEEPEQKTELGKKETGKSETRFTSEKTTVEIKVSDELYPEKGIQGAEFAVSESGGKPEITKTDKKGILILTDLDKNASYEIRQVSAPQGYYMDEDPIAVAVDENGRIDGEAKKEISLTNWILRLSVGIRGTIIDKQVEGENISLYSAGDELIKTWVSGAEAVEINDIAPGDYYIITGDNDGSRYDFEVKETKEIQRVAIKRFTGADVAVLLAGAAAAACIFAAVIYAGKRRAAGK